MGILHGNKSMVTDGLLLYLDSINPVSWIPGSVADGASTSAQTLYTTPGTYTFEVPSGITLISAACIGGGGAGGAFSINEEAGGGGGGGALSYGTIDVTPLEDLTVVVGEGGECPTSSSDGSDGGDSQLKRSTTILLNGEGGEGGEKGANTGEGGEGGSSSGLSRDGGGEGGNGAAGGNTNGGGGGGAAGYSGDGGSGSSSGSGSDGAGGGGGGAGGNSTGAMREGGGVGILGEGSNGEGGALNSDGEAGSGGVSYNYGGGGGGAKKLSGLAGSDGGDGAVRIVYKPTLGDRQYPTLANIADTTYGGTSNWWYIGYDGSNTSYYATSQGGMSRSNDVFDLNGTDAYFELSGTSSLNYPITTSVTLSVFVKFDAVGALKGLLTKNRSTNTQLGLWLDASSKLSFSANGSDLAGSTSLTTGTWYNLVGVQYYNNRKIYVNGVLDGTKTSSFGTTPSGSENWMLGQATGQTEFLDGQIANATIYNKALTAAEVLQNYNAQKVRFGL